MHGHQVEHPRWRLVSADRGRRVQRIACRLAQELGLHEQVAERRVRSVGRGGREDDLGVARHLDRARRRATRLVMRDAAQLDVVLGRDADLGVRVDVAVAAAELGAGLRRRSPRSSSARWSVGW